MKIWKIICLAGSVLVFILSVTWDIWEIFFQPDPVYMPQAEIIETVRRSIDLAPFPPSMNQNVAYAEDSMKYIRYHLRIKAPHEEIDKWIASSKGLRGITPRMVDVNQPGWPKECKWAGTGMGLGKIYDFPHSDDWVGGFLCIDPLIESAYLETTLDL